MQPSGVIITDLRDGESGLEVQFYVQEMSGEVVPATVVISALQVIQHMMCVH